MRSPKAWQRPDLSDRVGVLERQEGEAEIEEAFGLPWPELVGRQWELCKDVVEAYRGAGADMPDIGIKDRFGYAELIEVLENVPRPPGCDAVELAACAVKAAIDGTLRGIATP